MFSSIVVALLLGFIVHLYVSLVITPKKIRRILRQQGIHGPTSKILVGNTLEIKKARDTAGKAVVSHPHPSVIHDTASIFPSLEQWRKEYGPLYTFSLGKLQVVYVSDPEVVREITTTTSQDLGRPSFQQKELGPLTSNGSIWARQRKIMAPEFFLDKVKFGALQELMSKKMAFLGVPGLRHLPTKSNRKIWALEREITALILNVVKERQKDGCKKDLLQILLDGAKSGYETSAAIDQFILDNCRNIYSAGFGTSAVSASWCLMLLASNPEWQTRVRDEVREVCRGQIPDVEMLRKMKQLHMVIQETMRLYPPALSVSREVSKDMTIGDIRVPKGVNLWIMVARLHTDTEIWGPDALEFNPQRFGNGIAGACKSPSSYMPFGFGQRVCIISNFSFTLSSSYVHSPVTRIIIEPKHGVNILINEL